MKTNLKFKPKAGYVYVVTNECLKPVKAKGIFRGKMVKAVKIGNAKDFTNRLGSLNTAVYENFDFHLGIKTDDVVGLGPAQNAFAQPGTDGVGKERQDVDVHRHHFTCPQ